MASLHVCRSAQTRLVLLQVVGDDLLVTNPSTCANSH